MEFTFSSRTRSALLSESNYEIAYWRLHPTAHTSLVVSCTMMGTLTYMLMFISEGDDDSHPTERLTWRDTILTYRSQDPETTALDTAARRMLRRWCQTIYGRCQNQNSDGVSCYKCLRLETNFLREHDDAFREITCSVLNDYYSFASGSSGASLQSIPEEDETSFESLYP